ncbi:MAG TPA: hypothetical protein VHU90_10595 [Galbitalea sp.]|nr:hypothetical protein [Galbitalea sp.]
MFKSVWASPRKVDASRPMLIAGDSGGHVGVNDVITVMGYTRVSRMTLAFYYMPAGAPGMAR